MTNAMLKVPSTLQDVPLMTGVSATFQMNWHKLLNCVPGALSGTWSVVGWLYVPTVAVAALISETPLIVIRFVQSESIVTVTEMAPLVSEVTVCFDTNVVVPAMVKLDELTLN
jgi:hypothetical protein